MLLIKLEKVMIRKTLPLLFFIVTSSCIKKVKTTKLPDEYIGSSINNKDYSYTAILSGPGVIETSIELNVVNNTLLLPWKWAPTGKYSNHHGMMIYDFSKIIISGKPKEKGIIYIDLSWNGRHYPNALKFQKRYILEVK